ncbi:hypothetical protein AB0N81_17920 [Streptomyces sp. NPDC093510]|uniref:hypothetical protein n=1 Tax=Streptomyces sp. NPDC093510 TaxID=3155199 RepID=UPI00342375CD
MLYARTRLTYGEWLRRENRRAEARAELGAAHDLLTAAGALGARALAERATRELRVTGEQPRRPDENPVSLLTAQERLTAQEHLTAGDAGPSTPASTLRSTTCTFSAPSGLPALRFVRGVP